MKHLLWIPLLAACSKSEPPREAPATHPSHPPAQTELDHWYRAVIGEEQGTPIPVFVDIPASGDALMATGPDRVHAKLVSGLPNVEIDFQLNHTKIAATALADGSLDGTWSSTSKSWGSTSLSFHATPVKGPDPALRFPGSPGPDPIGTWKVELSKPTELGKLVLSRGASPNEVVGTFSFQTGNIAFIAGNQDGATLRMSAFDGASPYLLVGTLDQDAKAFTGSWVAGQGLDWKESLRATKVLEFKLEKPTKLATAHSKLELRELTQDAYKGHPVIVELGGSWCPACGYAASKLRELLRANPDLRVITLAYEFTDDPEYNKAQAAAFKAKYSIPWEVVPIDGGIEKYNDILPPEIESVDASGFPIAIFVHRDRTIEGFHGGFPPESWGPLHVQAVSDYDALTAKIVAK